jgi:hypothetical protein
MVSTGLIRAVFCRRKSIRRGLPGFGAGSKTPLCVGSRNRRVPLPSWLAPNYRPASSATTGANVSAKSAPKTK